MKPEGTIARSTNAHSSSPANVRVLHPDRSRANLKLVAIRCIASKNARILVARKGPQAPPAAIFSHVSKYRTAGPACWDRKAAP